MKKRNKGAESVIKKDGKRRKRRVKRYIDRRGTKKVIDW